MNLKKFNESLHENISPIEILDIEDHLLDFTDRDIQKIQNVIDHLPPTSDYYKSIVATDPNSPRLFKSRQLVKTFYSKSYLRIFLAKYQGKLQTWAIGLEKVYLYKADDDYYYISNAFLPLSDPSDIKFSVKCDTLEGLKEYFESH